MALDKIAHIERLLQEITEKFNRTNYRLSSAWLELEHTRETLQELKLIYWMTFKEQGHDKKEKKPCDLERFL